jgi:hypothetical protein
MFFVFSDFLLRFIKIVDKNINIKILKCSVFSNFLLRFIKIVYTKILILKRSSVFSDFLLRIIKIFIRKY